MGSAQLKTRRPIHLGRIIRSVGTGLSGLTLVAGLSGPDYWKSPGPVPRAASGRSSRGRLVGRIIRAGLLGKSGPGTECCAREVFEGPDDPVLSGRIIRPEVSATSTSSASPSPLPCLVQLGIHVPMASLVRT